MRVKQEYVLKTIGEERIIVPIKDEAIRFNGIITVNKTAAFLFELLQAKDVTTNELIDALLNQYDTTKDIAQRDVIQFINQCRNSGLLDE